MTTTLKWFDMADYKALSDKELVSMVMEYARRSVGYYDTLLSQEREEVMQFYNGEKPHPHHSGNSRYVSLDVYDAVESLKASLLETFAAGTRTVKFAPENADDVLKAEVCTNYTDYVAHRQNNLFLVMQGAIQDGLTSRAGLVKAYWKTMEESYLEPVENLTEEELDALLVDEKVEIEEVEKDALGLFSGELRVTYDTSQVCLENVPPEEFLIEPQAKSLDVTFCAHKTQVSLSDLRMMGYDEKIISNLGTDENNYQDHEKTVRHQGIGDTFIEGDEMQEQTRLHTVYEAYVKMDIEGTGLAELWKVCISGNRLLEKSRVNRRPFIAFVPLPIPHAFYGNNYAAKVIPIQNARTVLTRSILDHAVVTNNPRYAVTKGGLTNPRELTDNRVGGIVNVTRPDAILPIQQAPLNPFIFQTIQMLDEDKEESTGVSRLSQGLSKDAVSKQNSAAMIEQLSTMSQQRQKIIARNFANTFMKDLFQEIYQLCVENEQDEKIVELSGEYVSVRPSDWAAKRDVSIELHLGYSEQQREADKYLMLHQLMSQDPVLSQMYQMPNQHKLMTQYMEQNGIKNVSDYLTPPDQVPPPAPDPAQEMAMQAQQKQLELQERQTAVAEMKAEFDAQIAQMKIELDRMKAQQGFAIQSDGMDLKEQQQVHKEFVDKAELEIAKKADDVRAIASPTG